MVAIWVAWYFSIKNMGSYISAYKTINVLHAQLLLNNYLTATYNIFQTSIQLTIWHSKVFEIEHLPHFI